MDAEEIRKAGFADVRVLGNSLEFKGITLTRTGTARGVEAVFEAFPRDFLRVAGAVFSHPGTEAVYLAADTISCDDVRQALLAHSPDIIIVNCGNPQVAGLGRLIMNASDVLEVHKAAPSATLIGTHMEAVNHCVLSRNALRAFAEQEGFSKRLLLPDDGETISI